MSLHTVDEYFCGLHKNLGLQHAPDLTLKVEVREEPREAIAIWLGEAGIGYITEPCNPETAHQHLPENLHALSPLFRERLYATLLLQRPLKEAYIQASQHHETARLQRETWFKDAEPVEEQHLIADTRLLFQSAMAEMARKIFEQSEFTIRGFLKVQTGSPMLNDDGR